MKQRKSSARRGREGRAGDGLPAANAGATFWKAAWRNLFGIDPRSLAVFRMAMGLLLLAELAIRATDLNVMYTDDGMFPRAEICRRATTIWNWSFHFASGSGGYQAMLFGLAAGLAMALLAGFETRLAAIGSWLMLVSLHHRVPPILSGAEILFRMLLFWAMFLPLERVWSLDGWLDQRRGRAAIPGDKAHVLSVASAAILLQMALMYLFSAIYKSNLVWLRGEAIEGILAHSFYGSPAGAYLLKFPRLLTAMTWGTFALEWAAPLLLFSPRGATRIRLALIAALAAMHVAIGLCLEVGLFSHVALAGLILFLPAEFWNSRLLARFSRTSEPVQQLAGAERYRAKESGPLTYVTQGLCLMLLLYVLAININRLPGHPLAPLAPEKWKPLTTALGLGQRWGMFEAIPSKDGWYVARARLKDGSDVDLLRQGAAVDWTKPEFPARLYRNHFWQKLFREMAYDDELGFQVLRAPVAEYFCRDWNARKTPDKQIAEFDFIYCTESKTEAMNLSTPQILREQLVHLDLSDP
jgi:hypothetical protein